MTSIDDWHRTVTRIYGRCNLEASREQIFAHLQEQIGSLSLIATGKPKKDISYETVMPKALGWWMALCGKMRVRRVSDLIWIKFPGVCPYCLASPHSALECRKAKARQSAPQWERLFEIGSASLADKPTDIASWQKMFMAIYPPTETDGYEVVYARLCEEMGELAEALRVAQEAPQYFVSEAADVFSWLMKVQNIRDFQSSTSAEPGEDLETSLRNMYGSGCRDCNQPICTCGPISQVSVGRIGERLPESIFRLFGLSFATGADLEALVAAQPRSLVIGEREVLLSNAALEDLSRSVTAVLRALEALKTSEGYAAASLQEIEMQVQWLKEGDRVTQQLLVDLAGQVAGLEPDARADVLRAFESTTTGVVAAALVELMKALATGI